MPIINLDENKRDVEQVKSVENTRVIRVDGKEYSVELLRRVSDDPSVSLIRTGSQVVRVSVVRRDKPERYDVLLNGRFLTASLEEDVAEQIRGTSADEGPVIVSAPMAGKIASVKAGIGSTATEGQTLIVLEAMKMENEIAAPRKGTVTEIYVQQGALVKAGDRLCLLK